MCNCKLFYLVTELNLNWVWNILSEMLVFKWCPKLDKERKCVKHWQLTFADLHVTSCFLSLEIKGVALCVGYYGFVCLYFPSLYLYFICWLSSRIVFHLLQIHPLPHPALIVLLKTRMKTWMKTFTATGQNPMSQWFQPFTLFTGKILMGVTVFTYFAFFK